MAATGYTPISLYYSSTAAAVPVNTNLVAGELALNTADEKLYFKNSAGTVKLLASNAATTNVTTFSAGTTGFTPSSATSGAVTLAGTLAIANGGTNSTATPTAGGAGYGTGTAHAYTAAGTTGQVLTSQGASAPIWAAAGGGPAVVIVTGTTQAATKNNQYVLTNVAATTVTLPSTPTAGDSLYVTSGNGLATNVVAYSGSDKIMGLLENLTINVTTYVTVQFTYLNATIGWAIS